MFRLSAVLSVVVVLAGCRGAEFLPMDEDSEWVFQFRTLDIVGAETSEVSRVPGALRVVASVRDSALGRYLVAELVRDETRLYTLYFQRRPTGTYMLVPAYAGNLDRAQNEWILLLADSPRPGQAWYGNSFHEQLFEVAGREAVTVPAGRFAGCCRVDIRTDAEAWPGRIWYAPGVGPVKWEHRRARSREGVRRERVESAELTRHSYPGPQAATRRY